MWRSRGVMLERRCSLNNFLRSRSSVTIARNFGFRNFERHTQLLVAELNCDFVFDRRFKTESVQTAETYASTIRRKVYFFGIGKVPATIEQKRRQTRIGNCGGLRGWLHPIPDWSRERERLQQAPQ